ncbi:hypothetical protein N7490_008563 [Penicillium lividum]|nr:hypothetical protein N7490_008563 [Penicillium lividum]
MAIKPGFKYLVPEEGPRALQNDEMHAEFKLTLTPQAPTPHRYEFQLRDFGDIQVATKAENN